MLSIITINYNNRDGLRSTLGSIRQQQLQALEVIVIDGGSDDGSQKVISEYKDTISFSISEKDQGIYDAMNKGIQKAKGNFLLFLNSGDQLAYPDSLEKASKFLKKKLYITFAILLWDLTAAGFLISNIKQDVIKQLSFQMRRNSFIQQKKACMLMQNISTPILIIME